MDLSEELYKLYVDFFPYKFSLFRIPKSNDKNRTFIILPSPYSLYIKNKYLRHMNDYFYFARLTVRAYLRTRKQK